jgi:hypothetical protein
VALDAKTAALHVHKPLTLSGRLNDHSYFYATSHVVHAKESWFKSPETFRKRIIDYFEPVYLKDKEFLKCLFELREILYPG